MSARVLVLALAAGCLKAPDFQGITNDAGGPDAPAFGAITVNVAPRFTGVPLDGVQVIFANPDGTVETTSAVGADGVVVGMIHAGGTVFVAYRQANHPNQLVAVTSVNPGEVIRVGARILFPAPPVVATKTLKFPGAGDLGGFGNSYLAQTGCGTAQTGAANDAQQVAFDISLDDRCSTVFDLLLIVIPSGTNTVAKYQFLKGLNVQPDSTIDRTGVPYDSLVPASVTLTNVSGDQPQLLLDVASVVNRQPAAGVAGSATVSGTTATGTIQTTPVGDAIELHLPNLVSADQSLQRQQVFDRLPTSTNLVEDLAPANLAPWVTIPTGTAGSMTWIQSPTGRAQVAVIETAVTRAGEDFHMKWIVPAPSTPAFQVPELPATLDDFTLQDGDTVGYELRYLRYDDALGYDQIKVAADVATSFVAGIDLYEVPGAVRAIVSGSP